MKKSFVILSVLCTFLGRAEIQVSDVDVFSDSSWQKIAVGYTITGKGGDDCLMLAKVTDSKKSKTYTAWVPNADLSEGRHAAEFSLAEKISTTNATVCLEICPPYLVIDLSGGFTASSYPVSALYEIPGGSWSDEYKTTKLVLRRIDPGSFSEYMEPREKSSIAEKIFYRFVLGLVDVALDYLDEKARTFTTTLTKPFYMGVFEVTQKQWNLVMGDNRWWYCFDSGETYPADSVSYDDIRGSANGAKWPASSAVDSSSFLGKLQSKTGINFDLPTTAQREYACRAGSTTTYYWGDSMNGIYAWYRDNSNNVSHPVGGKVPNAWGLYDMSGNVSEWCLDWFEDAGEGLPSDSYFGTDPKGPSSGSRRMACGGGYDMQKYMPGFRLHELVYCAVCQSRPSDDCPSIGFRLSMTLQ